MRTNSSPHSLLCKKSVNSNDSFVNLKNIYTSYNLYSLPINMIAYFFK